MLKIRILAISAIVLAIVLGFFIFISEKKDNGKKFRLGLDLSGGSYLVYHADVSNLEDQDVEQSLDALRDIIERRINVFGIAEPIVQRETAILGTDDTEYRLTIELPGITDVEEAIKMIGETPLLEFKIPDPNFESGGISIDESMIVDGQLVIDPSAMTPQYISTGLTGQFLERSTLQFDPTTRQPIVQLQFNSQGADLFEKITQENIGKPVAIFLDGGIISEPVVQTTISGGQAVITGQFTPDEAKELVGRLNSGALPVPIELIAVNTIGPTLGNEALHKGIFAGILGFIFVALIMLVWYRIPGFIAVVALGVYSIIMLAIFKYASFTLTTAGIAGFVISLGMAVDANILIFERMKEELQKGHTLRESIITGFDRAWLSIRDGNISSILSAIILFWFGTPLIKGFALTFGVGVIVSMLSAITISRWLLQSIAGHSEKKWVRILFTSGISRS